MVLIYTIQWLKLIELVLSYDKEDEKKTKKTNQ